METPELDEAGQEFYDAVVSAYQLNPAELVLLVRAAKTLDLLGGIDMWLDQHDDLLVHGSMGQPRVHPLLAAKCDQEAILTTLIKGLALPVDEQVKVAQEHWRGRRGQVAR